MEERTGEAFELDEQLTVVGSKLQPGDEAPDFELDYIDPTDEHLHQMHLVDAEGKVRLINTVNSVDTPVCHVETRRWERVLQELPPGVVSYTISMDLPYALSRWRSNEHVDHPLLSAHKNEDFARAYGVLLKEVRLLQRAVFVVGRDGRIVYAEYIKDQMTEPDYSAAMEAVRRASDLGGVEF